MGAGQNPAWPIGELGPSCRIPLLLFYPTQRTLLYDEVGCSELAILSRTTPGIEKVHMKLKLSRCTSRGQPFPGISAHRVAF